MLRALHLIDLPYEGIWLDQLELVPFDVPFFDSGMFLARPFASISCFFTVDGVLVGLVVICIVFSFARTLTSITVTTSLLFATGCVSFGLVNLNASNWLVIAYITVCACLLILLFL